MPRKKKLIDLSTTSNTSSSTDPAEFLRITLAPRKPSRRHHLHHHQTPHLSVREERKSAFTKASWIQKHSAKCKLTLPKFKVSLVQQPVSGIVDKLRGAWSRVKHLLNTPSSSPNSPPASKSFSASKKSGTGSSTTSDHHPLTGYSHLNSSTSTCPAYHQDAVADCIEFIKQSAAKV